MAAQRVVAHSVACLDDGFSCRRGNIELVRGRCQLCLKQYADCLRSRNPHVCAACAGESSP